MRSAPALLLTLLLALALTACSDSGEATDRSVHDEEVAHSFWHAFVAGDYVEATGFLAPDAAAAISAQYLQDTWNTLTDQMGDYRMALGMNSAEGNGFTLCTLTTQFSSKLLAFTFTVTDGQIAGFYFESTEGVGSKVSTSIRGCC